MSSGSREILAYALETEKGVTPTPFDRTSLAFTDTSLDAAVTREESQTKLASRLAQPGYISAIDYTGDINAEFRYSTYDELIAAAAYNDWVVDVPEAGADTLTFGGEVVKSFSILRGYTDIENYHIFKGVHVNTFNLSIPETGSVTATFGLIGMSREGLDVQPLGTITSPVLTDVFSSVSITDIKVNGVSTVGVACITAFDFTWDNTAQAIKCLGGGGRAGNVLANMANGTGSYTMQWSKVAAADYEKQFTNTTMSLEVEMTDGAGNQYVLTLPKIEVSMPLASGSNTETLSTTVEYRTVAEAPTLTRVPSSPSVTPNP